MQLMTLNSLLMFDIVFIFFLFLVGVTCLVYYLPPPALSSIRKASNGGSQTVTTTCGTTTTCTGETVRFRRYSVGSLLSASDVAVGNHRFHSPLTADEDLVANCGDLEEILSLRGSPILVATGPPPPPPAPFCSCCCVEHHQQRELQLLQQHLIENPHDLAPLVQVVEGESGVGAVSSAAVATAIDGVDYVQIEIERTSASDPVPPCCYVRAKDVDVRECHGPIHDV
nr:uncharacterized protein LOC109432930 [Aedes albopictus]